MSETETRAPRRNPIPLCVRAMGCLCAWHACGGDVDDECDANEERALAMMEEHERD